MPQNKNYRTVNDQEITLLNPETVKSYLRDVGFFAAVCKDEELEAKNWSDKKLEAIGLHCLRSAHWSPTRATYFWFNINGISRVCSHQAVRSRIGVEINQRSQRDCKEKAVDCIVPQTIIDTPKALNLFLNMVNMIFKTYDRLIELEIPMEDARYILPNAAMTGMNVAITPQALFNLANERLCHKAQWEIRNMVTIMVHKVLEIEYRLNEFCVPKCVKMHYCPEGKATCGYYAKLLATKAFITEPPEFGMTSTTPTGASYSHPSAIIEHTEV